jgi:hypothetical protein
MRTWATGRRVLGLTAIVHASACGGALATQGGDGGAVGVADSAQPDTTDPFPSFFRQPPDSAIAADGGCSTTSVVTYEPPGPPSACHTCAKKACLSQLTACAADCTCNNAILGALNCVDDGSGSCIRSAMSSSDPILSATANCLFTAGGDCGCPGVQVPSPDGSCLLLGGDGNNGLGNRECAAHASERCGDTDYQVVCTCPEGTCSCFGPTTHVIHFAGCPYCPGDQADASDLSPLPGGVKPANFAAMLTLCGFPAGPPP